MLIFEKANNVPLLHYNLLSVSYIYDGSTSVLFNSSECLFLKLDYIILHTYVFDMNVHDKSKSLTCLLSKASNPESFLCHRRLVM